MRIWFWRAFGLSLDSGWFQFGFGFVLALDWIDARPFSNNKYLYVLTSVQSTHMTEILYQMLNLGGFFDVTKSE